MVTSSLRFVQKKFTEYYETFSSSIQAPTSIDRREFGFLLLNEPIMLRHKGFNNVDELKSFLKNVVPSDAYYSGAYYTNPEKEMKEKGWMGADLIFDIDADHIPTPCGKSHDTWVCSNCGTVGRGQSLGKCSSCGEKKIDEKTWPCRVCLDSAKTEAIKIIDVLSREFGFSKADMKVAFSGHRGYHVHVENEEIQALDSMARKEIVDYVMGTGLETRFYGLVEKGKKGSPLLAGPVLDDLGWRGRIARGTYDFLLKAAPEGLEKNGLRKSVIDTIIQNKETLLESWKEKGPWGIIKGIDMESWRKIAELGVKMQSVKIDTVVTTDIHRLIRLNNTLHGKTGLKKMEVPIANIESFDPLKSAVTFKEGNVTVLVSEAPEFSLEDENYGPYKRKKVELPTAAALFLLCKGVAETVR